jgi:hypothetical protein
MEVTLNKSWHLWLANFGENRIRPEWGTDICEYTRAVLAGTFWAVVSFSILFAVGSWALFSIYDIVNMIITGQTIEKITMVFFGGVAVLSLLLGIIALKIWWERRPVKEAPAKPPSFPKVVYRKFKDKTCFRIKFNE